MKKYLIILGLFCIAVYVMFNLGLLLPRTKITIKVVDEEGKPVHAATVSATFEVLGGNNRWTVVSITNKSGLAALSKSSTGNLGFSVEKEGYYTSGGAWHGVRHSFGKWEPWNPEIGVVLRKILKPVPMYARSTQMSKMRIPVVDKPVGFDLIKFDWVAPYGHGKYSDFIFKLERKFIADNNFDCKLHISFSNKYDGIQEVTNYYSNSVFKMPRLAPEDGYKNSLSHWRTYDKDSFADSRYYIFRIRSDVENGKLIRAMYGKVHGDIRFDPRGSNTASIIFDYYVNPDYSHNLEFEPKRNLFINLPSTEGITLP